VKTFVLAITALALCSASFAQISNFPTLQRQTQAPQANLSQLKQDALARAAQNPDVSANCPFPFTSGKNLTSLSYCVTGNGNIAILETPDGQPEIAGDQFEGYGVCDFNTGIAYSDFGGAGATSNWGTATVVSHNGTMVKIARTTSDGVWTLTQTINQVSGNTPNAKVTMQLTNNSNIAREAFLLRWADVDAAGAELNEFDATFNTAFAYNSIFRGDGTPVGLALQNEGNSAFGFSAVTYNTINPPDPCNPLGFAAGELISTDGSLGQIYLMNLGKAKSGTVIMAYRGL
jgi:hypothetical protein